MLSTMCLGLDRGKQVPRDLSLALGSGEMTPSGVAVGYSVFANGGFAVNPYFVQVVKNRDGEVV